MSVSSTSAYASSGLSMAIAISATGGSYDGLLNNVSSLTGAGAAAWSASIAPSHCQFSSPNTNSSASLALWLAANQMGQVTGQDHSDGGGCSGQTDARCDARLGKSCVDKPDVKGCPDRNEAKSCPDRNDSRSCPDKSESKGCDSKSESRGCDSKSDSKSDCAGPSSGSAGAGASSGNSGGSCSAGGGASGGAGGASGGSGGSGGGSGGSGGGAK